MLETHQAVKVLLDSMEYWSIEAFLLPSVEFVTDVMICTNQCLTRCDTGHSQCLWEETPNTRLAAQSYTLKTGGDTHLQSSFL